MNNYCTVLRELQMGVGEPAREFLIENNGQAGILNP